MFHHYDLAGPCIGEERAISQVTANERSVEQKMPPRVPACQMLRGDRPARCTGRFVGSSPLDFAVSYR